MSFEARVSRSVTAAALVVAVALLAAGCGAPKNKVTPTESPVESTAAVEPSQPTTTVAAPTGGEFPAVVTDFAKRYDGDVWYPTALPTGMMLVDPYVDELEDGSGLVCDLLFVADTNEIGMLQGSPTTREFVIESLGRVPWGTRTADVIYEDPEDSTSPKMIVFKGRDTLVELYGGTGLDQLKAIAASMVLVK